MNIEMLNKAWEDYHKDEESLKWLRFGQYVYNNYEYEVCNKDLGNSYEEKDPKKAYNILYKSITDGLGDPHKTVKFMFRDIDGNDLVGFDLNIPKTFNWLQLDKLLDKELSKFTGKAFNLVSVLTDAWIKDKKFPDGTHYFIDWNNDFGFISAYLYRVE